LSGVGYELFAGIASLVAAIACFGLTLAVGAAAFYLRRVAVELVSVKDVVPAVEGLRQVASEVKGIQEGEVRILQDTGRSIVELRQVVEEFGGMVFGGGRRPQDVTEAGEIAAERRRKERGGGVTLGENLMEVGKRVGTV
jgi:hypothetical protein